MDEKRKKEPTQKAADLIDNCPTKRMKELSASWVARKIKVNPSYLSRIFKQDYGCYLKEYIERAKMNRAKELLETTEKMVKGIAADLDYTNPGYFSHKFQKHVHMLPRDYRNMCKDKAKKNKPNTPVTRDQE